MKYNCKLKASKHYQSQALGGKADRSQREKTIQTDRCDLAKLCIIVYPLCFRKDSALEAESQLGSQALTLRAIFSLGAVSFLLYSPEGRLRSEKPLVAVAPCQKYRPGCATPWS